ncbi:MAG TPA: NAD(P)-dependent oxidoreductase [Steroidobacteraceae bacterium]|nr:NAD(P)-dependent oxidoreductase [Steroidobacteraceae bacterium]
MTILVSGSAGHLGEALVRTLRGLQREVVGLDMRPSPFTECVGSICNRAFVKESLRGVHAVVHAASLHKPHLGTRSAQDFVDTNVNGTLVLLEESVAAGVDCVIYTSTTSAFGAALTPDAGQPAVWANENLAPKPKNIYGVTKLMAESLGELFHHRHGLPVIVLRTSRFFPETDDDAAVGNVYELPNVQANELLYRRVDLEDVVSAHLLALERARNIGFARYVISATTPFAPKDLAQLRSDAAAVVRRLFPESEALFAARRWRLFRKIDRVYDNQLARRELGWQPNYDFAHVLRCLRMGRNFRSPLSLEVGSKGYHERIFADDPYPVS